MKAYKIHIKPIVIEAEDEEEADNWIRANPDKLEISLFEEVSLND